MRKLTFNTSNNLAYCLRGRSIFKLPNRKSSTIVMPLAQLDNTLIAEYKELLEAFRSSRNEYDNLLNKYLMSGKSKINKNQHVESLGDFDCVIALASGEELSKLSDIEKGILAEAYAYKAIVLSHGSAADVNMALAHLDKALELNESLKIAIECKRGILSEKKAPINVDEDFYREDKLVRGKT